MDVNQAQRAIESLRTGIPPDEYICHFTVGRKKEIDELIQMLDMKRRTALLIKANYGAGKTHLLRFIKEHALRKNCMVSYIALDARSGVRFNRVDQILGAALRNLELPGRENKGLSVLFTSLLDLMTAPNIDAEKRNILDKLSNKGKWDYSDYLKSPGFFVGLRAWITCTIAGMEYSTVPQEVEGWLYEPWNYYANRKWLYNRFVSNLRVFFRDPRPKWRFYQDETFKFNASGYRQSWDALTDLHNLAKLTGSRGLVLLVDEFEDVIYNLNRINWQMDAFWNLFQLFRGHFPGLSFYAVTPKFVHKCKQLLQNRGHWDYDFSQFDRLPTYELSPIGFKELKELSCHIIRAHSIAYGWDPEPLLNHPDLMKLVRNLEQQPIQDRTRITIRSIVQFLDSQVQEDL